MSVSRLLDLLNAYPGSRLAFNQYRDIDPGLDRDDGAAIRCHNLRAYLDAFAGARYVLVGEAAGYAGCRFSGIPFTCEAQILSPAGPLTWAANADLARSSTAESPWLERSASIVWAALENRTDCLLWNAFPWHPIGPAGPLSNGRPGRELVHGLEALDCVLSLFPAAKPYAIGRVAQHALATLGLDTPYIRHPSHGGARQFVAAISALAPAPGQGVARHTASAWGSGQKPALSPRGAAPPQVLQNEKR